MEITGVVAHVFMVWWDREYRKRLDANNIQLPLHKRYIDDSNFATPSVDVGARYDGEKLVYTEESQNEDADMEADKRTMLLLKSVADYIHPSIRMTIDFPSNHADGKIPMLDIKMWIEMVNERFLIRYYEKEMVTKAVMHARSAVPEQMKRTVLTQELLRRFVHCSRDLPWERVCTHANNFMKKLQFSGYDHKFRYDVVKSAIHAYETIKQRADAGLRPINRPKEWKQDERTKNKEMKKRSWYRVGGFDSVLFVPSTPGSTLKRMYRKVIKKSGIRIRVVERTGSTLKSKLQRSNPFRRTNCGRNDCMVCTTTGVGNCEKEEITYEFECQHEGCNGVYKGESSYNAYKRGKEQMTILRSKSEKSGLWKHCLTKHAGVIQTFNMKVTGTFRNDAMMRQITEAVQIENTPTDSLINTRAEWNMTRVPRAHIM